MTKAHELLDFATGDAFIGDTAYDSNELRAEIKARGIKPVIHSKPERKRALPLDRKLYGQRYLIEIVVARRVRWTSIFFHHLKQYRAIATRFEKTARNYLTLIHVACVNLWLH